MESYLSIRYSLPRRHWKSCWRAHAAAGIVLTNGNHERWAVPLAKHLRVEIWAHHDLRGEIPATRWFADGDILFGTLRVTALEGFVLGEVALAGRGSLSSATPLFMPNPTASPSSRTNIAPIRKPGASLCENCCPSPLKSWFSPTACRWFPKAGNSLAALLG